MEKSYAAERAATCSELHDIYHLSPIVTTTIIRRRIGSRKSCNLTFISLHFTRKSTPTFPEREKMLSVHLQTSG